MTLITIILINLFIFLVFNYYRRKKFIKSQEGKFAVEVIPSWFSKDYVSFRYTNNGGITWHTIYGAHSPYLGLIDYDWTWEPVTYKLNLYNPDFSYEFERWGSIEKISEWEKSEKERMKRGNEEVQRRRNEARMNREEVYKKINSK